ncbi:uncharacterized protein LOC143297504 [Babylonia areolata]|uniref:uncharacterized protein LOC143297504 n=1 Tax=Babylonia areolata TaxID=304850 RepID=UPI003FD31377
MENVEATRLSIALRTQPGGATRATHVHVHATRACPGPSRRQGRPHRKQRRVRGGDWLNGRVNLTCAPPAGPLQSVADGSMVLFGLWTPRLQPHHLPRSQPTAPITFTFRSSASTWLDSIRLTELVPSSFTVKRTSQSDSVHLDVKIQIANSSIMRSAPFFVLCLLLASAGAVQADKTRRMRELTGFRAPSRKLYQRHHCKQISEPCTADEECCSHDCYPDQYGNSVCDCKSPDADCETYALCCWQGCPWNWKCK